MKLTDTQIKRIKPSGNPYKFSDGILLIPAALPVALSWDLCDGRSG